MFFFFLCKLKYLQWSCRIFPVSKINIKLYKPRFWLKSLFPVITGLNDTISWPFFLGDSDSPRTIQTPILGSPNLSFPCFFLCSQHCCRRNSRPCALLITNWWSFVAFDHSFHSMHSSHDNSSAMRNYQPICAYSGPWKFPLHSTQRVSCVMFSRKGVAKRFVWRVSSLFSVQSYWMTIEGEALEGDT